jgi:catechol 2,3-dioxygenase-like lactoylglutathione lyase family enzyme
VSAGPAIQRLSRFSLTTADAERLAAFYESAFGCRRLGTEHVSGVAFETLMEVKGGALRITLSLGEQIVELLQFDHPGKPYPDNGSVSDLIFQHFAIVVRDMAEAYRRLSTIEGWTAISRGGPQHLPESSGGVTAFKFRDPEGHPLEFLSFPKGAIPVHWRERRNDEVCLGIDHSAISIFDTARSVSFYENLGFKVSSHSWNHGAEQEKLDDVTGAKVEVTALAPVECRPHLELLCYRGVPHNRRTPRSNADIATARVVFEASDCAAPHDVVDPDGHHVILEGQIVGETLSAE